MNTIIRELKNPVVGFRVPTYPNPQKTALYPLQEIGTVRTVAADMDFYLTRDPVLPFWGMRNTTEFLTSQVTFAAGTPQEAGTSTADYSTSYAGFKPQSIYGGTIGQSTAWFKIDAGSPVNPGSSVTHRAVLGRFGDSEDIWLYCPGAGAGQTTIAIAVGTASSITLLTNATIGSATAEVQLEVKGGLEQTTEKVTTGTGLTGIASTGTGQGVAYGAFALGRTGPCWVRPVGLILKYGAGSTTADVVPQITICSQNGSGNTFTPATSGVANLPRLNPGTLGVSLCPVVNLFTARTAQSTAAEHAERAIRVLGCALSFYNTTKAINIEGSVTCLRYMEGASSGSATLGVPPASFAGVAPSERRVFSMSENICTAMKVDDHFADLNDYFYESRIPVFRIYPNKHYHMLRFSDEDQATPTSLTYKLLHCVEFASTDVLLAPKLPSIQLGTMQQAAVTWANTSTHPLFWKSGERQGLIGDRLPVPRQQRSKKAPRKSAPVRTPKPKPKPQAKMWYNGGKAEGPRPRPKPRK